MGCNQSLERKKSVSISKLRQIEADLKELQESKSRLPSNNIVLSAAKTNSAELAKQSKDSSLPANNRSKKKVIKYRDRFDSRVVAKYDIKALIGRGTFSRVVRVEHRLTKQPFAIKIIEFTEGWEIYEAEVTVLRRVRHTNIVQLYEVFQSRDRAYMVMELATGGELFERIISYGHFVEVDAVRVIKMILEALCYLHKLGICHRDLKLENLLYYHPGPESKIMVTDFGLSCSRKAGDNLLMLTVCGTPEYISPEMLQKKSYTCLVDMWALGVITYVILSGAMPFEDENRTKLYRAILKAEYSYSSAPWADISHLAKNFIDCLLVHDTARRMSAVQSSNHPWITTLAASSSKKNLHCTISRNMLSRASTRSRTGTSTSRSLKSSLYASSKWMQDIRESPYQNTIEDLPQQHHSGSLSVVAVS